MGDHEVATVDFESYHRRQLPGLIEGGRGAMAFADVADLGALGLRLGADGPAFTYVPSDGTIDVVDGADAARTTVVIDQDSWNGLVADLETSPGLLYGGRAHAEHGNILRFVEWEPALRALYHGRPIFDPASSDLRDRDGAPLDTARRFTPAELEADPGAASHFLRTAGYLVVTGLFDADQVGALRTAADALAASAIEGDKASWWGKDAAGATVLCRVTDGCREPVLRDLADDDRLLRIAQLADPELVRARRNDDGCTVLWKNPDMTEGLSDLPWHRDCGMGGHASMCPVLVATVCLTTGRPEAGELRVLPGSHDSSFHFIDGNDPKAPTGVGLRVEAGDVSFHSSDLAHVSMPPTSSAGPFRISALVAFVPPDAHHHRGTGQYNDVLLDRDDGQVEHLVDKVRPGARGSA